MTNIELITQSYRLMNIIGETETPSAEQGALGLVLLNQMMSAWEVDDVYLQYFRQTDQQANFPCAPYTEKGVAGKLAEAISGHYGIAMTPEAAKQAADGYDVILRKAIYSTMEERDMSHLPQGEGSSARGDFYRN